MHTRTLKKAALALTFWIALYASSLRAQIFTAPLQASTTGSHPVDFEFRADGTLIGKGNYGVGSLLSTDQGVGTRMLWFPDLGAFRAGTIDSAVTGTEWNQSNIGSYSTAFGLDTMAMGRCSAAFGYNTVALTIGTAFGQSTTASGYISTAMGNGTTASGIVAFAAGQVTTASGAFSTALGSYATASGVGSLAFGYGNSALGGYSTALGLFATASGIESVSIGTLTSASGYRATALGSFTSVNSYGSTAIGQFNVDGGTASSWVPSDPLFEIGNGTSPYNLSDAFVVYKNGNADFQGVVTVAPGGDIPMYTGN